MIRPALQNDGGDITLVEIKDNSITCNFAVLVNMPVFTATMHRQVKN